VSADAANGQGETATLSHDALTGTLTVVFGSAEHLDCTELVEDLFLFFDASALGRLVKLQALLPDELPPTWPTLLTDCLGAALGKRSAEVIQDQADVVAERVRLPLRDWARLTGTQWPWLHQKWRSDCGLPPLPSVQPAGAVLAVDRLLTVSDEAGVTLPAPLATIGAVDANIQVQMEGQSARVVAQARAPRREPLLEATLVWPEPLASDPVAFTRDRGSLTAEIPLREVVDPRNLKRCVLHVAVHESAFPFVYTRRDPQGQVRQFLGVRDPAPAGTRFASPRFGRSPNRIYWRTGRLPTEVVVVREGDTLWARGEVSKPRWARSVRVSCTLTAAAVEVLRPVGLTGPGPDQTSVEGALERDGFFQIYVATVNDADFDGELVATLDLEIG